MSTTTETKKRTKRSFSMEGKHIHWSIDKHTLFLEIKMKNADYETANVNLPPKQLGRCNNWYVSFEDDEIVSFHANWDIRKIKKKLENIENITAELSSLAIDDT